MKICPDCGYFNEEKYDEYSPYPGECEDCYRYEICLDAARKESKMIVDDIWCTEEFINVAMNNTEHLTTEQVKDKPIRDENGVTIGRLTGADEDLIYGIVFSVSSIYKDATPASCSIEIVSEKGGNYD